MSQTRQPILNGKKDICRYVGRSWSTIRKWIDQKEFPARKLDGIWEADAELIIQWRQRQIAEQVGADRRKKINPKDWGAALYPFSVNDHTPRGVCETGLRRCCSRITLTSHGALLAHRMVPELISDLSKSLSLSAISISSRLKSDRAVTLAHPIFFLDFIILGS